MQWKSTAIYWSPIQVVLRIKPKPYQLNVAFSHAAWKCAAWWWPKSTLKKSMVIPHVLLNKQWCLWLILVHLCMFSVFGSISLVFSVNFLCTFVKTFAQIWYVLYAVKYCKCTLSLLHHLECISILMNNRQFTLNSLYLASVLNDANSKDVL